MNADQILNRVCQALDALIEAGAEYQGLFPSLLDRKTHKMVTHAPPAIEGQRNCDRAHLGSNLMHDHTALKAMYALAQALDREDYAAAANRYLVRFANHCTYTATGLFPWGEHSFWHLVDDAVGNSYLIGNPEREMPVTHDHLRQAPVWLWEKLQKLNPSCVERFAEGLNGHWTEGRPLEYCRHAYIEERRPYHRYDRSCDFPRHGGFFILDWTFAFLHSGREDLLTQIRTMLDYWWKKKDARGLLQIESRSPENATNFYGINNLSQTLSLGVSLLEAANLLTKKNPDLAKIMRERGNVYVDGFLAGPHDIENDVFAADCRIETNEIVNTYVTWGSKYGEAPAAGTALIALFGFRLTGEERLLEWAKSAAKPYLKEPLPEDTAVPARDTGVAIGLLADLYNLTSDESLLQGALDLAGTIVSVYIDGDLPRGSSKTDIYESQLGPADLLYALTRLALLAKDKANAPLGDYTLR
jgi:hypothetical protein